MSVNKRACRALALPKLAITKDNGLLYVQQVEYLIHTAVKNIAGKRYLIVYIYQREALLQADFKPTYIVFQRKTDFATLKRCANDQYQWRTARTDEIDRDWHFTKKCSFISLADQKRITDFCRNKALGFAALDELQKQIKDKQFLAARHKKQRKIIAKMKSIKSLPRDINSFLRTEILPTYLFYSYNRGRGNIAAYCSSCKQDIIIKHPKYNEQAFCPKCRRAAICKSRKRRGRISDFGTLQVVQQISATEVVVRILKYYAHYQHEDNPKITLHEAMRIFLTKDKLGDLKFTPFHYKYEFTDSTPWKNGLAPFRSYYQRNFYAETCGHLYHRNLAQELQGTIWQYSQLKQFYLFDREELEVATYLTSYYHLPFLEYLVKLGLNKIACYAAYSLRFNKPDEFINTQGRTLKEVLGLDKADIPFLQQDYIGMRELKLLQLMRLEGIQPNPQLLYWCSQYEISIHDIEDLVRILKYATPHKLMVYLSKQYQLLKNKANRYGNKQFENLRIVFGRYKDYISFCEDLDYDLTDSFILFPRKLDEAHDNASNMLEIKQVEAYNQAIGQSYQCLLEQYYYQMDNLTILPPKTAAEIVSEGQILHHCVKNSVAAVADKKYIILFLRKADNPAEPYYTLQVKGNTIAQARGDNNGAPTDEVNDFLYKWAKVKNLQYVA